MCPTVSISPPTSLLPNGLGLASTTGADLDSPDGAASNLNWTTASITSSGTDEAGPWIDVSFTAIEGDMHWVIHTGLAGAYQYFVNRAVPVLGEFRTLWRLDNATFPRGHTSRRDEALPPLSDYLPELKVQDETWLRPDGTGYITKYDFSAFVREQTAYGVYGEGFGSWYVNPGKDYYNGNHLKQELMVHRESATGDAVQLNMIHGTHFQVSSQDAFPVGKVWGPWLVSSLFSCHGSPYFMFLECSRMQHFRISSRTNVVL